MNAAGPLPNPERFLEIYRRRRPRPFGAPSDIDIVLAAFPYIVCKKKPLDPNCTQKILVCASCMKKTGLADDERNLMPLLLRHTAQYHIRADKLTVSYLDLESNNNPRFEKLEEKLAAIYDDETGNYINEVEQQIGAVAESARDFLLGREDYVYFPGGVMRRDVLKGVDGEMQVGRREILPFLFCNLCLATFKEEKDLLKHFSQRHCYQDVHYDHSLA